MKKVSIFDGKFASIMPAEIFTKKRFCLLDMEFTGTNEVLEISIQKVETTTEGLEFGEIQTERFSVENEVDTMSLSVHGITSSSNLPTLKEMWGKKYKKIFQGHTLVAYGNADFDIIRDIDPEFKFEHIDLYEQCVAEFDPVAPYTGGYDRVWSWTQAHMYTIIHSLNNGGSFTQEKNEQYDWLVDNQHISGNMSKFSLPDAHSSAGDVEMASAIFLYFLKEDLLKNSDKCFFYRCPYGKYKGEKMSEMDIDSLLFMRTWDLSPLLEKSIESAIENSGFTKKECLNCGETLALYDDSCPECGAWGNRLEAV